MSEDVPDDVLRIIDELCGEPTPSPFTPEWWHQGYGDEYLKGAPPPTPDKWPNPPKRRPVRTVPWAPWVPPHPPNVTGGYTYQTSTANSAGVAHKHS